MARKRPVIELPDPLTVAILRGKSPEERLRMAFGMWNTARILVRGTLRQEHPDWTEEEILAKALTASATERPAVSEADLQPHELMQKVADFLDRKGVRYRIVGSMASIAYGEPRLTNDIDVLADLMDKDVVSIQQEFGPPGYYLSTEAAREAIRNRSQFNILHLPSGLKVDVIVAKDTAFGKADLDQGRRLKSEGLYDAWFASPENVILMKLQYFREGGSEKHLRDIAGILLVQGKSIDQPYLDAWVANLGLSDEWQMVIDRIQAR